MVSLSPQAGASASGSAMGVASLRPGDFFVCDVLDAIPKNDMASMEHPVFSLSTRPDRRVLTYQMGDTELTITPSVKGLATIHDKDILIYCISQLVAAINAGRAVGQVLSLKAHDLLQATQRETSGDGYKRLRAAFERLAGTRITTNIRTDNGTREVTTGFGLIESWQIERATKTGRMVSVRVKLSDWLYAAVCSKSVLTLSREYFTLRKPLERRVYEICRKHCGRQGEWRIGLEKLALKSGSASALRVFRKMIRDLVASDHLPDYALRFERDILIVTPRDKVVAPGNAPPLRSETLDQARALLPGADIHAVVSDWGRHWLQTGRPQLRSPDAAFLGFVRGRANRGDVK